MSGDILPPPAVDIDDIFKDLCSHLSDAGTVFSSSMEFMALKTNLARMNYILELIHKWDGLIPEYNTKKWKCNKASAIEREGGNKMFKAKNYQNAVELYTKAVALGEPGSEALALAYSNRSAALFEGKQYRECIEDIYRSMECSYPQKILSKLLNRLEQSKQLVDKQPTVIYHEPIPQPTHPPNPYIECAGDCVEIKSTPQLGRYVVATKDIRVGDIIAVEKPYVTLVDPESYLTHCHNCIKLCYNLIPCSRCNYGLFCSNECKVDAFKNYHQYECPIIPILISMDITKVYRLALRVSILARNHYLELDKLTQKEDIYRSARYKEIHNLCPNTESRTNADLFNRAVSAAVVYELTKRYTDFFNEFKGVANESAFKELLLLHYQTSPSNFHDVCELNPTAPKDGVGSAGYSFLSMINHSCANNVTRDSYGTSAVLLALRPIKKGDQLFDNYGTHYAIMTRHERQKKLKAQYWFQCECEACSEDWPLYHDLPSPDYDTTLTDYDLDQLHAGDRKVARRLIDDFHKRAELLETMKPCIQLSNNQECIKQCYAIFGNKSWNF